MNNISFAFQKRFKILIPYFIAVLTLCMLSNSSFAGSDLGNLANNIRSSLQSVSQLIVSVSYVAGVGFALMGMLKFKAHKDNPTQVPLSQPLVLLAISSGLIFLPSLISTGGQTLWGGGQKSSYSVAFGSGDPQF